MTTPSPTERLDPALKPFAEARTNLSLESLGALRAAINDRRRDAVVALDTTGIEIAEDTGMRTYRVPGAVGAVLYCHSGAFVLGNLDIDHRQCVELARRAQCTVVSVDYRLAPEHPFPAGLDDALAVFDWMTGQFDSQRIAVVGNSAGGALAALVAQRRDEVAFQLLHQPVLDDRPTPSKREFLATPGFDGVACELMWQHAGADAVAPARTETLTESAPAFITCSELDPLRDEAIAYAGALLRAGVAVELYVVPGTCHGFDSLLPDWEVSQRVFAMQAAALRRALRA
jgi:acetyl esterase